MVRDDQPVPLPPKAFGTDRMHITLACSKASQPFEIPSSVLDESSTESRLHQRTTRNPFAYLCGCSYRAAPREETSWVRTRPSPQQVSGLRSVYPLRPPHRSSTAQVATL